MFRIALSLFFLGITFHSLAQEVALRITGHITNEETHESIPYASIYTNNHGTGTVSNNDGNFDLRLITSKPFYLFISHVGYKTEKILLPAKDSTIKVRLLPEVTVLREVVITSDESIISLLQDCAKNISKNYSTSPFELKGFFRESLRDSVDRYYYVGEAELLCQSSGYQYPHEDGRVRIIKSRMNSLNDSLYTHYRGGPFIGIKGDIVKSSRKVLVGDADKYRYSLKEVYSAIDGEVWVIEFVDKENENKRGTLYINKKDKAYARIEIRILGSKLTRTGKQIVSYKKFKGHWYLDFVHSEISNAEKTHVIAVDFSTISIRTDSITPIPLMQQLNYGQPFSLSENEFNDDFWNGNTIILPDTALQRQWKKMTSNSKLTGAHTVVTKVKGQKFINFLNHLDVNIGIQLMPSIISNRPSGINVITLEGNVNLNSLKQPSAPLSVKSGISYRINNKLSTNFNYAESFLKSNFYRGYDIRFLYSIQLPLNGNPVLLRTSVAWNYQVIGQGFEALPQSTSIEFGGTEYKYAKMRVYAGNKNAAVLLSLYAEKNLKGSKCFFLGFTIQQSMHSKQVFLLRKESGLFKNYHTTSFLDSNVTFSTPYTGPRLRNINFEIGLRVGIFG